MLLAPCSNLAIANITHSSGILDALMKALHPGHSMGVKPILLTHQNAPSLKGILWNLSSFPIMQTILLHHFTSQIKGLYNLGESTCGGVVQDWRRLRDFERQHAPCDARPIERCLTMSGIDDPNVIHARQEMKAMNVSPGDRMAKKARVTAITDIMKKLEESRKNPTDTERNGRFESGNVSSSPR
ncbi:MAG: hypothetical protein M1834_006430 [Cirrosporium novae-zelandiae]|nr:MAG: hypothetical protein M1834_006430 [Cirrosporium novae-zelandiae]